MLSWKIVTFFMNNVATSKIKDFCTPEKTSFWSSKWVNRCFGMYIMRKLCTYVINCYGTLTRITNYKQKCSFAHITFICFYEVGDSILTFFSPKVDHCSKLRGYPRKIFYNVLTNMYIIMKKYNIHLWVASVTSKLIDLCSPWFMFTLICYNPGGMSRKHESSKIDHHQTYESDPSF